MWFKDAKENLQNLRRTIGQWVKETKELEQLMWKEIEKIVVDIENLNYILIISHTNATV